MISKLLLIPVILISFKAEAGLIVLSKFTKGDTLTKTDLKTTEVVADSTLNQKRFSGMSKAGVGEYLISGAQNSIYKYNFDQNTVNHIFFHNDLTNITGIAANSENDFFVVKSKNTILRVKDLKLTPDTGYPYINQTLGECDSTGVTSMVANGNTLVAVSAYVNNKVLIYDVSSSSAACLQNFHVTFNGYLNLTKLYHHSDGTYYVGDSTGKVLKFYIVDSKVSQIDLIFESSIKTAVKGITENESKNILVSLDGGAIIEIDSNGNLINSSYLKSVFTNDIIDMVNY